MEAKNTPAAIGAWLDVWHVVVVLVVMVVMRQAHHDAAKKRPAHHVAADACPAYHDAAKKRPAYHDAAKKCPAYHDAADTCLAYHDTVKKRSAYHDTVKNHPAHHDAAENAQPTMIRSKSTQPTMMRAKSTQHTMMRPQSAQHTMMGPCLTAETSHSARAEAYRAAVDLSAHDFRAWYGLGQAYELLKMPYYALYYYRCGREWHKLALTAAMQASSLIPAPVNMHHFCSTWLPRISCVEQCGQARRLCAKRDSPQPIPWCAQVLTGAGCACPAAWPRCTTNPCTLPASRPEQALTFVHLTV